MAFRIRVSPSPPKAFISMPGMEYIFIISVSYTHLDVYKRQMFFCAFSGRICRSFGFFNTSPENTEVIFGPKVNI